MKATFPLGRVAGLRIGAHWSVLVIGLVLALGLAGRFPDAYPGRPSWQYWITGLLGAVVFLLSLLAHKLSHALVARRNGVDVDDITLWLLGCIARLRSEAPTPGAEVRIAGVGPLVSLSLGVLFGVLAGLFGALHGAGLVVGTLVWLAGINLLPAPPLDGGRLLRALVWQKTGNPLRATAVATGAGRVLGRVLIGVGLYLVLFGAFFSGFWLAVVGWFLIAMASAEGGRAKLRELLSGIPVRQAMGPDPVTVPASLTVARFLAAPEYRYRHSAFPVVDTEQHPVGLVNVKTAAGIPEVERDSPVTSVMIPIEDIPTPHPDDPLARVLPAPDSSPAHRALAVKNDRGPGTVTSSDISRVTSWLTSSSWRGRAFRPPYRIRPALWAKPGRTPWCGRASRRVTPVRSPAWSASPSEPNGSECGGPHRTAWPSPEPERRSRRTTTAPVTSRSDDHPVRYARRADPPRRPPGRFRCRGSASGTFRPPAARLGPASCRTEPMLRLIRIRIRDANRGGPQTPRKSHHTPGRHGPACVAPRWSPAGTPAPTRRAVGTVRPRHPCSRYAGRRTRSRPVPGRPQAACPPSAVPDHRPARPRRRAA